VGNTLIEFGANNKGVAEIARRTMKRFQDRIEQELMAAQGLGELSESANPAELAAFLVNTAQGLNVMAKARVGKETVLGIIRTALAMLG